MNCSNCGNPLAEGAKFCDACGQAVKPAQPAAGSAFQDMPTMVSPDMYKESATVVDFRAQVPPPSQEPKSYPPGESSLPSSFSLPETPPIPCC